ncbi:MAG: FHA domain-containing protein [Alphaproteobacteria bacterium]|nr:FHA domain-containing protein [Alphaproteobacteria bacterium]
MSDNRDGPTRPMGAAGYEPGVADGVTRPMGGATPPAGEGRAPAASNRNTTQVIGAQRTPEMQEEFDPMRDPVVGWLVVVAGVGRGTHRALGYGQNTVGRGDDARVKLIYGAAGLKIGEGATQIINAAYEKHYDGSVSRKHFIISYDERSRRFFIEKSPDSTNMTYIKDGGSEEPIMAPRELKPFDRIQVGRSELLFVPLCHRGEGDNPGFDWKDT